MDALRQDLRFALRSLRKSPSFSLIAILTITLAIGANTAVFSLLDHVVLRPVAFPDLERLIAVVQMQPNLADRRLPIAPPDYLGWREHTSSIAALAAMRWADSTITGDPYPEEAIGARVSAGYFALF